MKKMAVIFLAAFAAVLAGCAPQVEVSGAFYCEGVETYRGLVASGDTFSASGQPLLRIVGARPQDVRVRPLAEISSDKGGLEVGLTLGAIATVALVSIATWPLWGHGGGWSGGDGFDFAVPPLMQDVRVEVDDCFYFDILLCEPEGEGEGEPETAVVPDLVGLTRAQAESAIGATCLTVGTPILEVYSATIPAGIVVSWSPTGTQPCGTAINLVVSKGPEPVLLPMVEIITPPDGAVLTVGVEVAVKIRYRNCPPDTRFVFVDMEAKRGEKTLLDETVSGDGEKNFSVTPTLLGTGLWTARLVPPSGPSTEDSHAITVTLPKG